MGRAPVRLFDLVRPSGFSPGGAAPTPSAVVAGTIPATLSLLATTPHVPAVVIIFASGGLTAGRAGGRLSRSAE